MGSVLCFMEGMKLYSKSSDKNSINNNFDCFVHSCSLSLKMGGSL